MRAPPSRVRRLIHVLRAGIRTLRSRDFGVDLATVQDGLDLSAFEELARRMRADEDGRRLLRERPRLDVAGADVDAFRGLPDGTLGRELLRHLEDADLLRDPPLVPSPFEMSPDAEYAKTRWRETHDVRHVLTGLGVGLRDEVVLQAFQLGQLPNRFAVVQMTVGPLLQPMDPVSLIRDYRRAWLAGRRARPLFQVRWESLWDRRVEDLRVVYGVPRLTSG